MMIRYVLLNPVKKNVWKANQLGMLIFGYVMTNVLKKKNNVMASVPQICQLSHHGEMVSA